jgi:hypothetical protein
MGDDGIKYATVVSRSFAANYTTIVIDESELTSNLTEVHYGIVQTGTYGSIPDHDHTGGEATGGFVQLITLQDTPNAYDDTKYLKSTTSGLDWIDITEDVVSWFSGAGSPTAGIGVLGDYYQNNNNDYVYRKDLGGVPTAWNPLDKNGGLTLTNDDLTVEHVNTDGWRGIRSVLGKTSGKWYWEITIDNMDENDIMIGVGTSSETLTYPGDTIEGRGYNADNGNKYKDTNSSYGNIYTTDDVIGVALDLDDGKIWWSKNGVWQGSGDPATGLNAAYDDLLDVADPYYAMVGLNDHYDKITANFGATDFVYGAPAGFSSGLFDSATGAWDWVGSLTESLVGLADTPAGYDEGKYLRSTGSGIEWATASGVGATFLELDDTPVTYIGSNGRFLQVDADNSEIVFTTLSGVLQKTMIYTGAGEPTLLEPAQAIEQDYYVDTDTAMLYERQEAYSYILVEDTFSGTTLDSAKWGTRTVPYASVSVDNALELNNEIGSSWSGAYIYSQDTFNRSGITTLTCRWWPHNDHYSSAYIPSIVFRHPTDFSPNSSYGRSDTNRVILHLGSSSDSTSRNTLALGDTYKTVDSTSISISEMAWHDLEIIINWDTREMSVDLDSGAYQLSGLMSTSVYHNIGDTFRVEFGTSDYNKANTEKFDDVLLTTTNSGIWETRGIIDRPGGHWWDGNGAPGIDTGATDDYYLDNGSSDVYRKTTTASGFVEWNPDDSHADIVLSNGNFTATKAVSNAWRSTRATDGRYTGKWYWEVTLGAQVNDNFMIGIGHDVTPITTYVGDDTTGYAYYALNGKKYNSASADYGPSATTDDVIGVALDLDNHKIWWSKNGVWMASGDPANGVNQAYNISTWYTYPMLGLWGIGDDCTYNFGATAFVYTPPTGFNAGFFIDGNPNWEVVGTLIPTNLISLSDTPSGYEDDKYLRSTTSGTEWDSVPSSLLDLSDTPSTYSGIDGDYLRVTASGITTVSGIILTASDSSEWLLQVTNSGILYTTEVI